MRSHTVDMVNTFASEILKKLVGVEFIRSFGEDWRIERSSDIDRAQTWVFRQFPETPEGGKNE